MTNKEVIRAFYKEFFNDHIIEAADKYVREDYIQHNPTWKCGNCLTYCPVGSWYEKFRDTKLTNTDVDQYIDKEEV